MTTATDTRNALPPAKFRVEQIIKGRAHLYQVTMDDGKQETFGGVTGVLSVIAKPALIPWATNQGLSSMVAALIAQGFGKSEDLKADAAWIAEAIKKAKKEKKFAEAMTTALSDKFKWPKNVKLAFSAKTVAGIMELAIKAPDSVKDAAADAGTRAHAYFELYCQGKAPALKDVEEDIRPSVERFLKWVENSGLVIMAGDTKVASLKHGFGGALDAIFCVEDESKIPAVVRDRLRLSNGDYVLGDYKSSNGIYDEYALQVSAYGQALDETYGLDCHAGLILRFGKDQALDEAGNKLPLDFEQKWLANPRQTFQAFINAKGLQEALKRDEHFIDMEDA